jgi:hypothetical protein
MSNFAKRKKSKSYKAGTHMEKTKKKPGAKHLTPLTLQEIAGNNSFKIYRNSWKTAFDIQAVTYQEGGGGLVTYQKLGDSLLHCS